MTNDLKTKIAEAPNPLGHSWFECEMCGPSVRCGKCGNNCCNGRYGCDACPSAYDMQDFGPPLEMIQASQPKTEEG